MNNLLMGGIIFVAVVLVFEFIVTLNKGGKEEKEDWLPYIKKEWLLTRTEHEFFTMLEKVVSGQYYIFPQLAPDKIVFLEGKGSFRGGYRNKINQKSVDFVLFDKQNVSPVLVIELDDSTHERQDRQARDGFIDKVLNKCGMPILHVKPMPSADELRAQIGVKVKI